MNLSIGFITARPESHLDWFLDSLRPQVKPDDNIEVIVVDLHKEGIEHYYSEPFQVVHTEPKPTVWQGKCRLSKSDYWAASNSRNTALCLAHHEFISWCDDRCVLSPKWLDLVREARTINYVLFGSYEKRHNMIVEHGIIKDLGTLDGSDPRSPHGKDHRANIADGKVVPAPGSWSYGCTLAMPTDWALVVNGFSELFDGMGYEDTHFGRMLENHKFPLKYCASMKVIQDRTPSQCDHRMKRTSKQRFDRDPDAKDFAALKRFYPENRSSHHWDIRQIREGVLSGNPFPEATQPTHDWHDNQPISEFL